MKTIIFATILMATVSVQAAKNCGSKQGTFQLLSSAAEEIQDKAAKDERIAIDRTSPEFKQLNAIGVVSALDDKSFGSGFMVDACHVLTNHHVAFNDYKNAKNGAVLNFSVGQSSDPTKPFSNTKIPGKVVGFGNFTHSEDTRNADWVVIKLSKSVSKDIGSLPMYQMDMKKLANQSVVTAGFPGSKTENGANLSKIYADVNCKILGTEIYGYALHTCQTTPGQSGSPVLAKGNDGKFYAVGMVSGGNRFDMSRSVDPDKANVAVNFTSGRKIDASIESDGDKIVDAIKATPCN